MRVALYLRVSTDEQAREGTSIRSQKESLLAYARSQLWEVAGIYEDEGQSGGTLDRQELRRALADARMGRFDVLLVWKLDRLSRRQKDVLYLLEDVLAPLGIGFRSVTENFDTTTASGRAMVGMLAVFAQLERENIRERTLQGKRRRLIEGRIVAVPRAYGYVWDKKAKTLLVREGEAGVVRRIFSWAAGLDGRRLSPREISDRLGAMGVPTARGGIWRPAQVRRMLKSDLYRGVARQQMGSNGPVGVAVPSVITQDLFQKAQGVARKPSRDHAGEEFLLQGLLWCRCQAPQPLMSVRRRCRDKAYRYYVCRSKLSPGRTGSCPLSYLSAPHLEERVWTVIWQGLLDGVQTLGGVPQALLGDENGEEAFLRSRLRGLAEKRTRLLRLAAQEAFGATDLKVALAELETSQVRTEEELERATRTPDGVSRLEGTMTGSSPHGWASSLRKDLMAILLEEVQVGEGTVVIRGAVFPERRCLSRTHPPDQGSLQPEDQRGSPDL